MKNISFSKFKSLISIQPSNWKSSQFAERWLMKNPNDEIIFIRGQEFNLFLESDPRFTSGLIFYNPNVEWWKDLSVERKVTLNLNDNISPPGWKKDQIWALEKEIASITENDSFALLQNSPAGWETIVIQHFECFSSTLKIFQNSIDQKMFYCERKDNQISDLIIWNIVNNRYIGEFWWSTSKLGMKKLWGVHKMLALKGIQHFHSNALESNQAALAAHLLFGYKKISVRHLYTIGP